MVFLKSQGYGDEYPDDHSIQKGRKRSVCCHDRQDLAPEAWADTGNGENQGNMEIELSFNKFTGRLLNEYDSKGNYKKSGIIEGEWNLYFPVISSSADNKTWALNENMNDITITQIKATPANLIIDYQYPDTKAEDFEDIRVNIFDQDGNPIPYDRIYFGILGFTGKPV